jgi:hypothetical protein
MAHYMSDLLCICPKDAQELCDYLWYDHPSNTLPLYKKKIVQPELDRSPKLDHTGIHLYQSFIGALHGYSPWAISLS